MSSQPLRMLLVAEDRLLLRQLSRLLAVSGYSVVQVAEPDRCRAACQSSPPDLVVVDADLAPDALCEVLLAAADRPAEHPVYSLLLLSQPTHDNVKRALAAGADDFLAKPVVFGELLARLRAGARALEFERRIARRRGVNPLTGLPSRGALAARLDRMLTQPEGRAACVVLDLDFLRRVNRFCGRPEGDRVLRLVARRLRESADRSNRPACLGGGRFAVVRPGESELEAAAWADRLRLELAEAEFGDGTSLRLTASFGVAAVASGESGSAETLLSQAEEAVLLAKGMGRNCVVRFSQLADDARAWADLAAPGKLFERTVAGDVMTPCPVRLQSGDALHYAAEVLEATQLGALPVVGADGNLVGVVTDEAVRGADARDAATTRVADKMMKDVPTCEAEEPFDRLRELFSRDGQLHLVVVANRRPIGLVTADNLAALGARLTRDTFATAHADAGRELIVPDLRPEC